MAKNNIASMEKIRQMAEKILQERPMSVASETAEDYETLLHELCVHQIELEIQNEELRATQQRLQEARNEYLELFHTAPVGYLILDESGFIRETNQTFARMTGKDAGDIVRRPFGDLLADASKHKFLSKYRAFFKNPRGKEMDLQLDCKGPETLVRLYGNKPPASDADAVCRNGERVRIVAVDISRQHAAEKALADSYEELELRHRIADIMLAYSDTEMFSKVLETILDYFSSEFGYFGYIDGNGDLVCPSMTRAVFAKCEVPNKSIVFPRSAWGGLWGESLKNRKSLVKNAGLQLPDGHLPLFNALAVPVTIKDQLVGQIVLANRPEGYGAKEEKVLTDICEWIAPVLSARLERDAQQKQKIAAENALRQAQRMESIGVLASGVAHDFNNILSPIIGYTDMMLEQRRPENPDYPILKQVLQAGNRARDLVGQLLAFSRKQMIEVKRFDINVGIRNLAHMLKRLIRENISIQYDLHPEAGFIQGDAGQIDQILINLAANARDAMPSGGTLAIGTARVCFRSAVDQQNFSIPPGRYCRITVRDSGGGIPKDILPFIFDPFFTTKTRGQGTGMGLATCYGIVKQHRGYIWAENTPVGTLFTLLLPAAEAPRNPANPEAKKTDVECLRGRGETIMVVEDDSGVRRLAVQSLKRMGYQVFEAESPVECLQRVSSGHERFQLLLSDVIMPDFSGIELFRRLKALLPELKVIFMSGYTENDIQEKEVLKESARFMAKPFSYKDLLRNVREVIDGENG